MIPTADDIKGVVRNKDIRALGVAWYREEDFTRWRELDPTFTTYPHWLSRIEAAFAQYERAGLPVKRVVITPDEFLAWSRANGRGTGTEDRAAYVAMLVS